MAYCPPELLDDLADVIAEVRALPGVVEKKPHVFYVGRDPFLHFHLLAGARRRADVKGRADWSQLELPRPIGATTCRVLVREIRRRHREKTRGRATRPSRS